MKLLTSSKEIRDGLSRIKPSRIAVAFVGSNWRDFVPAHYLEEIILSPTLGSNPKAIEDLFKELSPARVHFLDELHSKIYLGKSQWGPSSHFNIWFESVEDHSPTKAPVSATLRIR